MAHRAYNPCRSDRIIWTHPANGFGRKSSVYLHLDNRQRPQFRSAAYERRIGAPLTKMATTLNPEKALIFRIVHLDNLPWTLDHGLHASNGKLSDLSIVSCGVVSKETFLIQ